MKKYNYTCSSILKVEISNFVELRLSQGYKDKARNALESLDRYLTANNVCEKSLTPEIVDGWIKSRYGERSSKTANNAISYYNTFAKYLYVLGITVFLPDNARTKSSYIPYIFSKEEMTSIFRVVDNGLTNVKPLSNIQFPMLLRLMYGCGLRLGEALFLRVSDIDISDGVLKIRNAKGNKDRLVPMDDTLTEILRCYCTNHLECGFTDDLYLFASDYSVEKGKPRSGQWAGYLFRKALSAAGIELLKDPRSNRDICLYCLRHTFAVNSFRQQDLAGVDNYRSTPFLSIYMGHWDLEGTQTYLHMTAENSEDIMALTTKYSKGLYPEVPQ
jgi:integrase